MAGGEPGRRPVLTPLLVGLALAQSDPEVHRDAPGEVMPARLWDVTHLDLDVRIDLERGTIQGVSTHTLKALGRPRDRVRLHQAGLDIQEVRVDGEPSTDFRVGPQWIEIRLPPAKDGHELQITYTAEPDLGLHFRGPAHGDRNLAVWSQGEDEDNRYWFPSWDYPNDAFTMAMHVTVPDGLEVRANGDRVGTEPAEPGWTRHDWAIEQPITSYHVALVAGELRSVTLEGSVPMEIVGPASFDEAWLKGAADDAVAEMAFFEELLDEPFPYPVYRQAWVERFMYGGMENPGLTTLAARRLVAPDAPDRIYESEGLIAHELAHQWFGDLLTCYGWSELWLNEGFASYYAHLWLEHKYGPDFAAVALYNRRSSALRVEGPVAARAHSFDGRRNNGVYVKGASVLHLLRVYLGDAQYHEAIRHYIDANRFRFVESDDLRRAFEDVSGEHLGWVFDQWVYGKGLPSWKSTWAHADGALTVTVTPKGEGPVFHTPVEIEVGTPSGAQTHHVWLQEGATKLVLPAEAPPLWVAVDPRGAVLGHLEHDQTASSWLDQLQKSPSAYAQVVAMHALADEEPTDSAIEALDRIANGDRTPRFRRLAAETLGSLASHPSAQVALLKASRDADATVREAALEAMSNTEGETVFIPRLIGAVAEDPDAENRASALFTLAYQDDERAAALARKRLGKKDDHITGIEHAYAADVLGDHGDLADGNALLRFMDRTHPRQVRRAAAQAVIVRWKDAEEGKKRDALQGRAATLLLGWLDDPDFRVRSNALRMLREIGRPEDIDALQAYADRTAAAEHDTLVDSVIRSIRTPPKDEGDPVEELRKRLDALSDQVDEANGRLKRLEEWRP